MAYWWIDRCLPSLVASAIWGLALWLSHRRLRTHIDTVTKAQNAHIDRLTADQTEVIGEITAEQTKAIKGETR